MPEPTGDPAPLRAALSNACAFAVRHGVDPVITPADFGIRRSATGVTNATYVDSSHAVTAFIDRYGETSFGVARLEWVHLESDHDRPACRPCGECVECRAVPCECRAGRDANGNIRMDDGRGALVAHADHARAHVQTWRDHSEAGSRFAVRYDAALALFDRESTGPSPVDLGGAR